MTNRRAKLVACVGAAAAILLVGGAAASRAVGEPPTEWFSSEEGRQAKWTEIEERYQSYIDNVELPADLHAIERIPSQAASDSGPATLAGAIEAGDVAVVGSVTGVTFDPGGSTVSIRVDDVIAADVPAPERGATVSVRSATQLLPRDERDLSSEPVLVENVFYPAMLPGDLVVLILREPSPETHSVVGSATAFVSGGNVSRVVEYPGIEWPAAYLGKPVGVLVDAIETAAGRAGWESES